MIIGLGKRIIHFGSKIAFSVVDFAISVTNYSFLTHKLLY